MANETNEFEYLYTESIEDCPSYTIEDKAFTDMCPKFGKEVIKVICEDENPAHINHIYAWQAGMGKNFSVINIIASHPENNYLYIANTHDIIAEMAKKIRAINSEANVVIIKGFERCCPLMATKDEPDNKKTDECKKIIGFLDKDVPKSAICYRMGCVTELCPYKQQWKDIRNEKGLICATALITLNSMVGFDFGEFEEVYVDEDHDSNGSHDTEYKHLRTMKEFRKLKDTVRPDTMNELNRCLIEKDGEGLSEMADEIDAEIFEYNQQSCKDTKKLVDKTFVERLIKVNANKIAMHYIFESKERKDRAERLIVQCDRDVNTQDDHESRYTLYPMADEEDIEEYETMKCNVKANKIALNMVLTKDLKELKDAYKGNGSTELSWLEVIFFKQMKSDSTVIFTDTMLQFKCDEFVGKIREFQKHFPSFTQRTILHYTEEKNKTTVITQNPKNAYFTGYVEGDLKGTSPVRNYIRNIRNRQPNKKICVLTYKKLITDDIDKIEGKEYKFMGADAFWFGSAGGINKFEKYDILVVVGTYMPPSEWYEDEWANTYSDPLPLNEKGEIEFTETLTGKFPTDRRLNVIFNDRWLPTVYNCVHRIRPLSHDVEIQWFGKNIPNGLHNELSVIM